MAPQEQEQQAERIKQNIKMENDRNRVISHVNNKISTQEKKIEQKNISRKHSKNENSKVDARQPPPSGVKQEEVDHPPSICAAWLGHTIKIVKKSKEADVLKAAISTAQQCAAAAGDLELWLSAANSLLAELQATDQVENIVDQHQVKTADVMSLSEANAATTTLQQSKMQPISVNNHESSHEQSVSETQNDSESTATRFKKMTSAEKRKLKSKLRGHVSKRATSKLGSINKWIKDAATGKLTPTQLNAELKKMTGSEINLHAFTVYG